MVTASPENLMTSPPRSSRSPRSVSKNVFSVCQRSSAPLGLEARRSVSAVKPEMSANRIAPCGGAAGSECGGRGE